MKKTVGARQHGLKKAREETPVSQTVRRRRNSKLERGHYYEVVAEEDIYADDVAQRQYEQALAMGAPYEQAVYAGQVAHEIAAAHFEEEVTTI